MRLFGVTQPAFSDGWTCRRCDNNDHGACEDEVNGLYCTCPCDKEDA
jgi:hypothetical protein